MRFTVMISALLATLAVAKPLQPLQRDGMVLVARDECCCYEGGTECFLHASDLDGTCNDADCAYIEEQDSGLTEGETEAP
ncbi:hypothetical protein D6D01_03331 [Aureobasidium pullulans]|uniref:Extracellular membrane protein CFEM domain-containing protein n=1 Tax=Aureobasidium pullulans TaxID=5580 RepID=A0A4S9LLE4_AURPU|nr:hypothetical protein D6D01_03331 [Aureobasidium pullulans]